ncbi:transmembrane protein 209 [Pectinophora gossypiella]|uniref:transmembrane protein 209 n=1 Tax=Pectinophora gossypiella TaxID=13191 RepID=UPI00214EF7A7|nr:transmembrane protein 209 [Pectinophora gossypiella]
MCLPAPDGELLRRALDLEAAARLRARWLRGAALNAALLLALAADLSCKCAGYTSALHWVELAAAGVAGANLLRLALALLRPAPPPLPLRAAQRRLLARARDDSFPAVEESFAPESAHSASSASCPSDELSLSLSPRREWRPPPSPPSPPPAHDALAPERPPRDRFIADRRSLADYLQAYSERQEPPAAPGAGCWVPAAAPAYQLAAVDAEAGADEGAAGADALAAAWARLHLDPQRLTQFNLNLRLWLHVTILSRLVREMAAVDVALARLGLGATLGELAPERLRVLARAPQAPPSLAQLLPFLEPFPNQRYVVRRIRELASGGCLSEYRWNGGGADWDEGEPCDAELVLHLLATYLDSQLPAAAPGLRPFSAAHISAAPAPPARPLALHRVSLRPPHYVLALGADTLELARGRNNLLHSLLVFLAAAARAEPPALRRVHLGPAGLNMLWIIGR